MKKHLKWMPGYPRLIRLLKVGESSKDFLLKVMPKNSVCAEIGVDRGDFSKRILDIVKPVRLHLIDPWKYEEEEIYKDSLYGGTLGGSQAHMDKRYQKVVNRFQAEMESGQVVIHRGYSEEVCDHFEDQYFSWIYIDGNHLYEFVKKDLELYYDKVKENGFITGDDYVDSGWWQGGVKKAVDEFVAKGYVKVIQIKNAQFITKKEAPRLNGR